MKRIDHLVDIVQAYLLLTFDQTLMEGISYILFSFE